MAGIWNELQKTKFLCNVDIKKKCYMNNTIFDDVFRTMIEKMPYLAVPLINEVFHTSYPEDVKITQLRNEHQQEDGVYLP